MRIHIVWGLEKILKYSLKENLFNYVRTIHLVRKFAVSE